MELFRFHPVIRIRLILQFLTTMASMSVIPFLIIFFSEQLGSFITGFLFLAVMAANITGSFAGGYISDQIGRKKVILFAEFIIFIGYTGAAIVNSPFLKLPYVTFAIFIFIQLSSGIATPVYQALIVDVSNPENRKAIYTYSYWLRNMAAAIGSMAGAFLFYRHHFILFTGVAVCTLISLLITCFFIKETYFPKKQAADSAAPMKKIPVIEVFHTYKLVLFHRFFLIFTIGAMLLVSVEEQLTNYIGVRLTNVIHEPVKILAILPVQVDGINLVGMLKTVNTLMIVFCTMFFTKMIKDWNEKTTLVAGLGLFFIGYTIISFSTSPVLLLASMVLASAGEIMYAPIQQTILANAAPDGMRSSYMAVYSIAVILGVSTAGLFLIFSGFLSPIIMTTVILFMGIISTILFWRLDLDKVHAKNSQNRVSAKQR